jgi:uncharacterized protein YjbI with pentapeptide repeats
MAARVHNRTFLQVGFFACQRDPRAHALAVVVKGTFRFAPGAAASPVEVAAQRPLSGDAAFDDEIGSSLRYPSDFAPFKPRADVLLVGTCHQPRGEARGVGRVALGVGGWSKALAVLGERRWTAGALGGYAPGDPKPFRSMPIRYERAFGGPAFPANPLGMGLLSDEAERTKAPSPLPHVELVDQLIRSPRERPAPAGFGPLHGTWGERRSKMGTYDAKWRAERWPWFPDDFDWGYFNAAPADQQIAGYLRGDEAIALEGMHPELARVASRLPGLRPRCFLRKASPEGARVEEVPLSLDTLWIDADAGELVLAWRGLAAVASKRFAEVEAVGVDVERLEEPPRSPDAYRDPAWWRDGGVRQEELAAREEVTAAATREPKPVDDDDAEALEEARAMLARGNAPPELLKRLESERTLDGFLAALRAEGPRVDPNAADAAARRAEEQGRDAAAAFGQDPAAFEGDEPAASEPRAASGPLTRDEVARRHGAGERLSGLELSGLDLSGLDLSGARMAGANLDGVSLAGASLVGADLGGATLRGAKLAGAALVGAVLEKARLDGADLEGADLSLANLGRAALEAANLRGAVLEGTDLTGATLTCADLEGAQLSGAQLEGVAAGGASFSGAAGDAPFLRAADLTGADLGEARLPGANFTGCVLDRARFERAVLAGASFERSRGVEVTFAGADLTRARASGAALPGARFDGIRADGSIFTGADLPGARFAGASLERAELSEACLDRADFDRAVLKQATLTRALLRGAVLTRVNLFRGQLEGADLTSADVRASNLFECELLEANTTSARFDRSNLARTKLERRGTE